MFCEPSSSAINMAKDEQLLSDIAHADHCLLHFHTWEKKSATFGYFIDPNLYLRGITLDLARRPTGGGILFHTCDLSFALLVPASHKLFSINTLENYATVNSIVSEAIKSFMGNSIPLSLLPSEPEAADKASAHFCFAKPTKYDVMLEGRKVGGGAQRRTKHGFLHQGSISLGLPSQEFLDGVLLPGTCVAKAMEQNSYALLPPGYTEREFNEAKKSLQDALISSAQNQFFS